MRRRFSALMVAIFFIALAVRFGDLALPLQPSSDPNLSAEAIQTNLVQTPQTGFSFTSCSAPCRQYVAAANAGVGETLDLTVTAAQTTGSTNVLHVTFCRDSSCILNAGGSSLTVSDDCGNTYNNIVNNTSYNNQDVRFLTYAAENITGCSNVIHIAEVTGNDTNYLSANLSEWAAAASSVDQSGSGHGTSTTPSATAGGATSQANEIVIGAAAGGNTMTQGAGYTTLTMNSGPLLMSDEYKLLSATGTPTADFTQSSSEWLVNIITLKYTPAGGASRPCFTALLGVGGC